MKIAGLDIGTTACKLCVYDENGQHMNTFEQEYPPCPGTRIDVNSLWAAACQCLRAAAQYTDLAAIGITSFGETCVLLDEDGEPLMDALLYTDPAGEDEANELAQHFGSRLNAVTGLTASGMYSLPKMMWMRRHAPELFQKAVYIPEIEDFVVYRLTGVKQTDYSLASRTMAFDVRKRCWDEEILAYAGISSALLSAPVPTGTAAGPLLPDIAKELGLPQHIQIVSISHDQVAAAVGAGALCPGQAVDGGGTVQCITPVYQGFPTGQGFAEGKFSVVPYLKDDQYVSYAFFFTGGALLKWYRDSLLQCNGEGGAFYARMNSALPEGPTGILTLPHFAGAGTPYMDPLATGAIMGLTPSATQAHIYKALMESVAYEMRLNIEKLGEAGIPVTALRATGGASRSPEWLQIKADILGLPITALKNAQCGAVGSIMLAGCAIGAYGSLEEAAARFVEEGITYLPNPERHRQYTALFAKYSRAYAAVKEVFR